MSNFHKISYCFRTKLVQLRKQVSDPGTGKQPLKRPSEISVSSDFPNLKEKMSKKAQKGSKTRFLKFLKIFEAVICLIHVYKCW